jgi:hypothetical protein
MIDWLSSHKRQEKRKAARDAKLREELAAKVNALESDVIQTLEDFTELTIEGMRRRVPVDRITE